MQKSGSNSIFNSLRNKELLVAPVLAEESLRVGHYLHNGNYY